jgi:hypothetical protein
MRADEKYAEIGGRENAPKCDCHGVPMGWQSDERRDVGGNWRCSFKNRERSLKWAKDNPVERNAQRRRSWQAHLVENNARQDQRRRDQRIERMENELKELLNAS